MHCPQCGCVKFELYPIRTGSENEAQRLPAADDYYLVCSQCELELPSSEVFARRRRRAADKKS